MIPPCWNLCSDYIVSGLGTWKAGGPAQSSPGSSLPCGDESPQLISKSLKEVQGQRGSVHQQLLMGYLGQDHDIRPKPFTRTGHRKIGIDAPHSVPLVILLVKRMKRMSFLHPAV